MASAGASTHDPSGAMVAPARLTHCMRWLGLSKRCVEIATTYAHERFAFGERLSNRESIRIMLGDLAMQIEVGRLLVMKAAWALDQGSYARKEVSMAKNFATDVADRLTYDAVQVLGGMGYMRETSVERFYRHARLFRIYEGTSEVQKLVIAKALLAEHRIEVSKATAKGTFRAPEGEDPVVVEPGDYVVRRVVDDSFIVSRDESGAVRAMSASRPSGSCAVTGSTDAPSGISRNRSRSSPSMRMTRTALSPPNRSASSPATRQCTSSGATPACASRRAAPRQPS